MKYLSQSQQFTVLQVSLPPSTISQIIFQHWITALFPEAILMPKTQHGKIGLPILEVEPYCAA